MVLHSYFNQDTLSDAVIEAGDHTFKVHKLVLCAHSPVFRSAFVGKWKVSKFLRVTVSSSAWRYQHPLV